MMLGVLDEGLSARLESRLIREKRILTAVNSAYNLFARGDSLLTITAVPAEGHTLEEAKAAAVKGRRGIHLFWRPLSIVNKP